MCSSNAGQCVKMLLRDMAQDRQYYISLIKQLEQQRELIIGRRTEELNKLNQQLITLYQQLKNNSQRRHQLLTKLGFPANTQGVRKLLTRLPESHRTKTILLWNDLEQRASDCKIINDYNMTLLNMQQEILQKLLNEGNTESWLYQQR